MFTAAKQRKPVSAFSRDGLRVATGSETPPVDEQLTVDSKQLTVDS
jgi:hypothetical protein